MNVHVLLLASSFVISSPFVRAQEPACPPPVGHIEIDSGSYSSQPGVTFKLTHFSADLVPDGSSAPRCYGKRTVVAHAEIFAENRSLTNVFASKLAGGKSKIRNFKVVNTDRNVVLSGVVVRMVPIHFSISGRVKTDGTAIMLEAKHIDADGVPVKSLLTLFGQNLSSVMKVHDVRGVSLHANTITFEPAKLAHLEGHITSAESTNGGLVLRYGTDPMLEHATPAHP